MPPPLPSDDAPLQVWVVALVDWDTHDICGVFVSEHDAREAAAALTAVAPTRDYDVESFQLNELADWARKQLETRTGPPPQ